MDKQTQFLSFFLLSLPIPNNAGPPLSLPPSPLHHLRPHNHAKAILHLSASVSLSVERESWVT